MSNYLFISSDTPSELLVPVTPVNHELEAISDRLIYVPLATRNTFGIIKVGEGLNINNGLLSFDRSELDIKLSTNVGSENAGKFLYVSDNGNISFVDQIQNITKVSELENDAGYITKDVDNLTNYYTTLRVDSLFDTALASAEEAKAIAMGKPGSKTFDTYGDMIAWLGNEEHIGELIVGASLYIKADGPDYWVTDVYFDSPIYVGQYPSYYGISPLESKLPDITNMMTTDTPQVVSEYKIFNKYITFNEDIRTSRIYTTALKNLISGSDNNLRIGDLLGNNNLVLESWNRPTIQIINNTPEYIAFVSEIPTKVSELENDSEFLTKSDVVDSVYITDTNLPLSANQGKLLNDKIEDKLDVPEVYHGPEEVYICGQIWTDAGTSTKSVFTPDVRIIGNSITIKKNTTNGGSLYAEGKIYQGGKEVANKEDIPEIQDVPTKTSQLENDSGFITADEIPEIDTSNLVTLTGDQTISGRKTFDNGISVKFGVSDKDGNSLIASSGNLSVYGNNEQLMTLQCANRPTIIDAAKTQPSQQMAYLSDIPTIPTIPTTLPNPYSFTVNGVSYNGSSAQSISGLLQDSGFSKSTSGYMKFSNGFIIQWRDVEATKNTTTAHSFPIAFPNACFGLAMNHRINSVNDTDNMSVYNYNSTTFYVANGHGSNASFNIIAVGY